METPAFLTRGTQLAAMERNRQIMDEGYDHHHDTEHDNDELAMAAICYATPVRRRRLWGPTPQQWPWTGHFWKPSPDDRVRELVKAGALIIAEIDRLLDAESRRVTEQLQS